MNSNCESFYHLLNEYVDRTINSADLELLNTHLETCRQCNEELNELRLTINTIKKLQSVDIPNAKETYCDDIINKIKAEQKHKNVISFSRMKYAVAAIILVALLVSFTLPYILKNNPSISKNTNNTIIEEYADDFYNIIYESDTLIAESDISSDDFALMELYEN